MTFSCIAYSNSAMYVCFVSRIEKTNAKAQLHNVLCQFHHCIVVEKIFLNYECKNFFITKYKSKSKVERFLSIQHIWMVGNVRVCFLTKHVFRDLLHLLENTLEGKRSSASPLPNPNLNLEAQ